MEAVNTRWGVMSVLVLLVVVWMRLGRYYSLDIDCDSRQIKIVFTVTGGPHKSELNVLINGSRSLQKNEVGKLLYRTILS